MRVSKRTLVVALSGLAIFSLAIAAFAVFHVSSAKAASGISRTIGLAGTGSPTASNPDGDTVNNQEFANESDSDAGMDAYSGTISGRSLSQGAGAGASTASGKKAKSSPQFVTGFEGLNHYQQRYSNRGNQFSIEPPDQGMCAGNGYVVEAVNDVFNVYSASTGASVLPDNTSTNIVGSLPRNVNHTVDLNSFYGYPAAINRSNGRFGPELTDPTCIYDAATQRFFLVVLTLDRVGMSQALALTNHLDLAVSKTSNPAGLWNIYKIDVTNDGTNTGGQNPGPYLGDH